MADGNDYLQDLITQAEARGGVVLKVGQASRAVVLSIEKYNQLLALQPVSEVLAPEQRVLVIGGGGAAITTHVVQALHRRNFDVVLLTKATLDAQDELPAEATVISGSASDKELLTAIFQQYQITSVLYIEDVDVEYDLAELQAGLWQGIQRLRSLLDTMIESNVQQLLFSSTGLVYGEQRVQPIPETAAPRPRSPYAHAKLLQEQLISYYAKYLGFRARVLRSATVYEGQPGQDDFLSTVIEVAKGNRERVLIQGNDFNTFDGTYVHDYVHVDDVADAFVAALSTITAGKPFSIYNIASGKGCSEEQIVSAATEVLNRMVPIEIGPRPPSANPVQVLDISRTRRELGFEPKRSNVETLLKSFWDRQ